MDKIYTGIDGSEHVLPEGERAEWRVSCYGIIERNGKFLMLKSDKSPGWEFPGGGVDQGEDFLAAACREVQEETGHEVLEVDEMPFFICQNSYYHVWREKFYDGINLYYKIKVTDNPVSEVVESLPGEVDALEWVQKDDLINSIHFGHLDALKAYLDS